MSNQLAERDDPATFARQALRDDPWDVAAQFMRAAGKPNARVAIRGCHASTKTHAIAQVVLWFIARYPTGIAVTTAPTDRQVEDVLWGGEIHPAIARSRLRWPKANQTEIKIGPNNYATGFTTNKGEQAVRFQGYHAPHLLFVLDEAPGIPPEIMDAIEGAAAGGDVRVVLMGNPTIPSGPFFEAFGANRDLWTCFAIDAYDTPNFAMLREMAGNDKERITDLLRELPDDHPAMCCAVRPYMATPLWAKRRLREWGSRSPRWQARVRGQFPEQAEDALLSLRWLEAAKDRPIPQCEHPRLCAGVDVAGPGEDECVAFVRCLKCGAHVNSAQWAVPDPRGDCIAFLRPYLEAKRLDAVNVDAIGIGYNFARHLEDHGLPVNDINVGEAANDGERFANLKAEFYWGLRERFENGEISGLLDETTISQLATIRYKQTPAGKTQIESKDDARKRGVKSPDRAEAVMLAYAQHTPGIIEYYRDRLETSHSNGNGAVGAPITSPIPPEPQEQDGGELMAEYQRVLKEAEGRNGQN